MDNNKEKDFFYLAMKMANLYSRLLRKNCIYLFAPEDTVYNFEEAAVSIMMLFNKKGKYTTQDFLADMQYFANKPDNKASINSFYEQISMYDIFDDNSELDYDTYNTISNTLNKINIGLKEDGISIKNIFRKFNVDEEIIDIFLNGKKEDIERLNNYKLNFSPDNNKAVYTIILIYGYCKSFIHNNSTDEQNSTVHQSLPDKLHQTIVQYSIKYFYQLKNKRLEKYHIWRNYVFNNLHKILSTIHGKDECIEDIHEKLICILTFYDGTYMNSLDYYFNVINSLQHSHEYKAYLTSLLKSDQHSAIRPYYIEYCKKHNIPIETARYIGQNITEAIEQKEVRLFNLKNEKIDKNKDNHFNLTLNTDEIETIYNELKGYYIAPDTDIHLFCYRLTGKIRPQGGLSKIHWIADSKSLTLFIKKILPQSYGSWKKTCEFFVCDSETLTQEKLKVAASRILKNNNTLISNETNLVKLEKILDKILISK